jgi:large conductance mechanosensitive channel
MWREFKAFLVTQNVVALAIAVVIGAATGRVVTAIVEGIIMPIVQALLPMGEWETATVTIGGVPFAVGMLASALLNFTIVALVVWQVARVLIRPAPPEAKPTTRPCPYCLQAIDAAATRCAYCTSEVARAA